jgi:hypothetical protein
MYWLIFAVIVKIMVIAGAFGVQNKVEVID